MPGIYRPVSAGPDVIAAASGTSTATAIGPAKSFWVYGSAAFRVVVNRTATPITLDNTNSTLCAAAVLYGPFDIQTGYDQYIHVAGSGGASNVTITLA